MRVKQEREGTRLDHIADITILFGGGPALLLSIILWAVASTFAHEGTVASILALLTTILQAFIAVLLIVHYARVLTEGWDIFEQPGLVGCTMMAFAVVVMLYLAGMTVAILTVAGSLEIRHVLLMVPELFLVGYQIWRIVKNRAEE